jgi:hypothetical protein
VDLNRLYFDHQLALIHASLSDTCDGRHRHASHASHIAGRIGTTQRALGASAARGWEACARSLPAAGRCPAQVAQGALE